MYCLYSLKLNAAFHKHLQRPNSPVSFMELWDALSWKKNDKSAFIWTLGEHTLASYPDYKEVQTLLDIGQLS